MNPKQEHQGKGDNVGGNKIENKSYNIATDIHSKVSSKVDNYKRNEDLDLGDNTVLKALKEVIRELIQQEQEKAHQIVPIGKIRTQFLNLFDDDIFENLIKELIKDGQIEVESSQICFTKRQTNFKISI